MGITKQVSPDGAAVAENNGYVVENEKKETRSVLLRPELGITEEEESRINGVAEDPRNMESKLDLPLAQHGGPQMQQQHQEQSMGTIIRWERFLPVRTLKVLIVENDDSTRQVVSALLRNCCYEVTAVANGLQAWKILEDLTNHIDLVLTEVVMPCLSGIGLLDRIMNHKTCKNIPVIMMSSNDSMGTIFKCLSKGAVDFLVKPIRKNELKNLWQHVWRRCHSSSGSGSSGIQTQKSVKSKSVDDSDNNSGSNDDDDNDNESSRLNARDGSDNGSGTQSSWTKRTVEIESPQRDQLGDPPDSTCAQVFHPKPETFWCDWVPKSANGECQGKKELEDDLMGKDLEIGVPKHTEKGYDSCQAEKDFKLTDMKADTLLKNNGKDESVIESKNLSDEPSTQAADLIGAIGTSPDMQSVTRITQAPNGISKVQDVQEKTTHGSVEFPSLELSLKRLRSTTDGGTVTHEDRNVLRRSNQSAFTRYHTSVASNQAPAGYGGSSPFESSSEAMRTESTYKVISNSNATLKQGSNSSSNINDMGSTTKNVFTNPSPQKEKTSTPTVKCTQNVSAFQPVQNRSSTGQQLVQEKTEDEKAATTRGQSRGQHQVQVHHHHHHYHHHHLHVHNMQQQQQPPPPPQLDRDGLSVMATDVMECGSSDVFGRKVEGNATNYSVHGSNSVSNHGSNGHNGSSTAVKVGELNIDTVNGNADQYGHVGGNGGGSGSGAGVDQHRFTQREAALKKFRQKRKERNFEKKVRYQSRKRLAEQRPRIRGQFVRQTTVEEIGDRKQRDDNDGSNGHTCTYAPMKD